MPTELLSNTLTFVPFSTFLVEKKAAGVKEDPGGRKAVFLDLGKGQ